MLAKDGYDVKIVTINNGTTSLYNEVSWENAAEGKEGTVTYEDETFPVAPETSAKIDELLKKRKMKKMMMKKRIPLIYLISLIPHSKASSSKICLSKI